VKRLRFRKVLPTLGAVAGAVLGLVVALVVLLGRSNGPTVNTFLGRDELKGPPYGRGVGSPPPRSVQDYVNRADAIVIGTLSDPIREGEYGPYDGGPRSTSDEVPPRALPKVDYEILIEQVLLDDGRVQSIPYLRVAGRSGLETNFFGTIRMPVPGKRYILALRATPDNQGYGLVYPWELMSLEDTIIRMSDWDQSPPKFTTELAPDDFIAAVKAAALHWKKAKPADILSGLTFSDNPNHP